MKYPPASNWFEPNLAQAFFYWCQLFMNDNVGQIPLALILNLTKKPSIFNTQRPVPSPLLISSLLTPPKP